jgi:hypothetical protein
MIEIALIARRLRAPCPAGDLFVEVLQCPELAEALLRVNPTRLG